MHKYVHIWKKGEFNLLYNIALNLGAPTQPNFFLFVNIIILFFVKRFVQIECVNRISGVSAELVHSAEAASAGSRSCQRTAEHGGEKDEKRKKELHYYTDGLTADFRV